MSHDLDNDDESTIIFSLYYYRWMQLAIIIVVPTHRLTGENIYTDILAIALSKFTFSSKPHLVRLNSCYHCFS